MNQPCPIKQAAVALGVHEQTLRRWTRAGCPVVRAGHRGGPPALYDLDAVRAWRAGDRGGADAATVAAIGADLSAVVFEACAAAGEAGAVVYPLVMAHVVPAAAHELAQGRQAADFAGTLAGLCWRAHRHAPGGFSADAAQLLLVIWHRLCCFATDQHGAPPVEDLPPPARKLQLLAN